ncbi:hypothetical protein PQU94_15025 [Asticcacaulis sp. DXS10W]|uniref:Uncharacterized protein n=1 Tax=Asticcacaulis currens TaxID=2984210 RepID=A0ABT5IHI1_9CAUL|nr:hypothetical protein [Asticcacaulis currens]MDC7695589.1 hypothetical protein [Asticcacaulis currens]
MKTYCIFPSFELVDDKVDLDDLRVRSCVELIATMVFDSLRQNGDHFQYTVDWRDPGSEPWVGWTDDTAQPHVISLADAEDLASLIRRSVDPFSDGSATVIRSIATCRAATFGYDGQAILCLRHEDEVPKSPDTSLVMVEERPDILAESDYFDGWLRKASPIDQL